MNGNFNAFEYVRNQCFSRMLARAACPQPLQAIYNTYRLCNAPNFYEYYNSFYALYNATCYAQPVQPICYPQYVQSAYPAQYAQPVYPAYYAQNPQYVQPVTAPYYAQPVYAVPVRR